MAGGGYVAFQSGHKIAEASISYGDRAEVFDAEARAAVEGIRQAIISGDTSSALDIWICLDNQEVALRLLAPFLGSSTETFQTALDLQYTWQSRPRPDNSRAGSIRVRWVPGHLNVPGNELADTLARQGASQAPLTPLPHSWASLKHLVALQLPRKHLEW